MTKTAKHLGQPIAYTVHGPSEGEVVVVQHAWSSCKEDMVLYAKPLVEAGYRCISVDSLGHGESGKPDDPGRYRREPRAGDVAAVLDAEGIDRAHVLGYSMGGWTACCVAEFHAHRLKSLMIGGHCPETGSTEEATGATTGSLFSFDDVSAQYGLSWSDDAIPGMRHSFDALEDVAGHERAVAEAGVPVLLWKGQAEPIICKKGEAMAARNGWAFFAVEGDHMQALVNVEAIHPHLLAFLAAASD